MNRNPWREEWIKLGIVGLCGVALGQITGSWFVAVAVTLSSYLVFIGFKLHEVLHWLNSGMRDELTPESNGVIGRIISLVYRHKKTIEQGYEQQQATVRQFNEIISAIPSATVILNQDNEIEWANYPALLLLGINAQKDVGIKIDNLLRQADFSKQLGRKNGEEFEMVSPIDANMTLAIQVSKYVRKKRLLLAHNITPHIEIQRSRKTFIANASHELRTPLTVISGYLEFMHSDEQLPERFQIPVNRAIEQSENMQVLIRDLLTLSSLENKDLQASQLTHIVLDEHLGQVMQTLDDSGKTKDYRMTVKVKKGLFIEAAEEELNSVCYNLINNAIKYSETGTKITVAWQKLSKHLVKFSVTDQGIGIAPEHIKHLSERFYRVDSGRSRRVGGTGLGLSIVKHIVERHNGRIEVHSRLGEGSTFSVILPIYPLGKDRKASP